MAFSSRINLKPEFLHCCVKWVKTIAIIKYLLKIPGPWPSEEADPEPLEKAKPLPKFTIWLKNSFLTNTKVLKGTKRAFFVPNFWPHFYSFTKFWN